MKRYTLYMYSKRDFDLINLMMNPIIDFNKLVRSVIENYAKGQIVFFDAPEKTNFVPEQNTYQLIFSIKNKEAIEILDSIPKGMKSEFIKRVIRASINGGLLDYYTQTAVEVQKQRNVKKEKLVVKQPVEKKKEEIIEPKEQSKSTVTELIEDLDDEETKPEETLLVAEEEPDLPEDYDYTPSFNDETSDTENTDYDFFADLAAMGATVK